MIAIIDYGMGNLRSVLHKVKKIYNEVIITSKPEKVAEVDKIILPGVGAFDVGMENLYKYGLKDILDKKVIEKKTPILGICLGMQLFSNNSEEGNAEGLGWINAETQRFSFKNKNLKIPHVGWNSVEIKRENILFRDIPKDTFFYFSHSYHLICKEEKDIVSTTFYGYDFVSSIQRGNIYGTQFHPEKSHKIGMKVIQNFLEYG